MDMYDHQKALESHWRSIHKLGDVFHAILFALISYLVLYQSGLFVCFTTVTKNWEKKLSFIFHFLAEIFFQEQVAILQIETISPNFYLVREFAKLYNDWSRSDYPSLYHLCSCAFSSNSISLICLFNMLFS